jgi:hypothetical protein
MQMGWNCVFQWVRLAVEYAYWPFGVCSPSVRFSPPALM